jgi:hypothetical protein
MQINQSEMKNILPEPTMLCKEYSATWQFLCAISGAYILCKITSKFCQNSFRVVVYLSQAAATE